MSLHEELVAKLDHLVGLLAELEQTRPASLEEYLEKSVTRRNAERLTQLIVQCGGDLCTLVVSERPEIPAPDTLYEAFLQAAAAAAIPRGLAAQLAQWAKTRNVLVHEYNHLEDESMYATIEPVLGQFSQLAQHVRRFLVSQSAADERESKPNEREPLA